MVTKIQELPSLLALPARRRQLAPSPNSSSAHLCTHPRCHPRSLYLDVERLRWKKGQGSLSYARLTF